MTIKSLVTLAVALLVSNVAAQCLSNADCASFNGTSCCYSGATLAAGAGTSFMCASPATANATNQTCMGAADSVSGTICKGQVICTVGKVATCTSQAVYAASQKALASLSSSLSGALSSATAAISQAASSVANATGASNSTAANLTAAATNAAAAAVGSTTQTCTGQSSASKLVSALMALIASMALFF